MPPVNHVVALEAGVLIATAAVTAAVAIYKSPEVQRHADAVRRHLARVLHQIGDGINPPSQRHQHMHMHQPFFNQPEDAYEYWQSQGQPVPDGNQPVDADEESRRRQREEIMYWNAVREERERQRQAEATAAGGSPKPRGTSFDDFLQQDRSAGETGAFVFNSGADVWGQSQGLIHRRGAANAVTPPTNPFADDHVVEKAATPTLRDDETDIYSTTTTDIEAHLREHPEARISPRAVTPPAEAELPPTLERRLADDEFVTAGGSDLDRAFANVQAWARDSQPSFYSPLPMTPAAPVSEPSVISDFDGHEDGQATPTDSVSLIGDDAASHAGEPGRPFDVLSESEGIPTPASWSEVGSVVSDEENWRR